MNGTLRVLPEPNFWNLIDAFARAYRYYETIFERYEQRVAHHVHETGTHRRHLRLEAAEVADLIDYDTIEELRDGPLYEFKYISHFLLRDTQHRSRDKLDRFANELFHTISMLKEVQFMVSTFATEYDPQTERDDYAPVLAEAHEEFPLYIQRTDALFQGALARINTLYADYRKDRVFVRSLFLYGDEVFGTVRGYTNGVEDVYWKMYPYGPVQGFVEAARAFHQSGFQKQTHEAIARAQAAYAAISARFTESKNDEELRRFSSYLDEVERLCAEVGVEAWARGGAA